MQIHNVPFIFQTGLPASSSTGGMPRDGDGSLPSTPQVTKRPVPPAIQRANSLERQSSTENPPLSPVYNFDDNKKEKKKGFFSKGKNIFKKFSK